MTRTTRYVRTSALPAIAAALALSSTPLLAQATQPVTDPATTATQPATTTESPPPVTDTAPVTPDASATVTPDPAASVTSTTNTRTVRTTHTARAAPKPVARATATHTQTATRTPAPAPVPAQPTNAAPAPANSESAVAPVVDLNAKPPAQPAATPAKGSNTTDEMLPIAGGALALLALGGAAYAVSRRRRREEAYDEEWVEQPAMMEEEPMVAAEAPIEHEAIIHDEQPAIVAPSAFAWGNPASESKQADRDSDDDRLPGETWVERAYRGPSANNPSVSLKARLRRAAFFDKRERDVAAGLAEPVDPDAGLPEAMTEEQERELA